jgi:hypothetical protein
VNQAAVSGATTPATVSAMPILSTMHVAVRRIKPLTYEFDVSESVSLNKDGAIAKEYTFPKAGTHTVACSVQDDQGGERAVIQEQATCAATGPTFSSNALTERAFCRDNEVNGGRDLPNVDERDGHPRHHGRGRAQCSSQQFVLNLGLKVVRHVPDVATSRRPQPARRVGGERP